VYWSYVMAATIKTLFSTQIYVCQNRAVANLQICIHYLFWFKQTCVMYFLVYRLAVYFIWNGSDNIKCCNFYLFMFKLTGLTLVLLILTSSSIVDVSFYNILLFVRRQFNNCCCAESVRFRTVFPVRLICRRWFQCRAISKWFSQYWH